MSEFVWSDTNELISAYYARYLKNATPWDIWWCGNGGLALLAVVGLFAGLMVGFVASLMGSWLIGIIVGIVLAVIGAFAGIAFREAVLAPNISRRVCGVTDTRSLR